MRDCSEGVKIIYNYTENQTKTNVYADINDVDVDPLFRLNDALMYLNNNGFQIEIGEKSHTLFVAKGKDLIAICNVAVIKGI